MKLITHVIRTNPSHIEEIQMEDVASITIDDSVMRVRFNKGEDEVIPLRANNGEQIHEWSGFSLFGTRIGMQVDMTK